MTNFVEASSIIKIFNYTDNSFLPHTVTIPLSQEYGVTSKALVKPGDIVKEGEIIASNGTTSYIHSSVPGKVIDILPCIGANGIKTYGIKIQTGGKFTYLGKQLKEESTSLLTKTAILDQLNNFGVINTFQIGKPVNMAEQIVSYKNAEYLLVRLFDEDNFRYTDSLITKFYLKEIIDGAKLIAKAFNAKGIVLAINSLAENKAEIQEYASDFIKIIEMNIKRYPSGTKREIISAYNRTYKKLYNFDLTKNNIFIDASSAYETYKALCTQVPSISKPVFFSGNCLNASCLLNVRLGTSVAEIVSQLGGFVKTPGLVLVNGMIVGNSVPSIDIAITKYVKSITIMSKNKATDKHIYTCVNCGHCRFICPPKLSPDLLFNNSSNYIDLPEVIKKTALACTNCGLCNIVCPSRLPLSQTINVLKEREIAELNFKAEK